MDDKGEVTNRPALIGAMGFFIDQKVIRKKDKQEAVIRKIGNDTVQLDVAGELHTVSSTSFLDGDWKEVAVKRDPSAFDWVNSSIVKSPDFTWACMKGHILESMRKQFNDFKMEHLAVYNPRDVKAAKPFAIGKLILPCCTHKVSLIEGDDVAGLVIGKFETKHVVIGSCNQFPKDDHEKGCISPFWSVRTNPDKEKCNMSVHVKVVELKFSSELNLPIMKNFKKVEAGESLVLHQADVKKAPVEELQPLKRQRLGRIVSGSHGWPCRALRGNIDSPTIYSTHGVF